MLKKPRSLRVAFAAWLAGVFLIVFALPMFVKISECEALRQERQSTNNADQQKQTKHFYADYLARSGLCEEAKLTDIALVFFTFCLVIVGWFTIRSTERATRNAERPYIFANPRLSSNRSPAGHYIVEILLQNYGRTPGALKAIYGEDSPTVPSGKAIYKKGNTRTVSGMLQPTSSGTAIKAPASFECATANDFFLFGYVDYDDLSGVAHTSRYCAKIFVNGGRIEAAGSEEFNDFN